MLCILYGFAMPNKYEAIPDAIIPSDKKYLRLTRSATNPLKIKIHFYCK